MTKHKWRTFAWCGTKVEFRCEKCSQTVQKEMTKKEIKCFKKHHSFFPNKPYDVHWLWHKFNKKFRSEDHKWKWNGWKLIQLVEKWVAKQDPNMVRFVRCDDSGHAGSNLLIFEHKSDFVYMGTTIIFFPQCFGEPAEFFLYPHHRVEFIKALQELEKDNRITRKKEKEYHKQRNKEWDSVVELPDDSGCIGV